MNKKNTLKLFRDDQGRDGSDKSQFTQEELNEGQALSGETQELQLITASELELVLDDTEESTEESTGELVAESTEETADEALFGPQTEAQSRKIQPKRDIPDWEKDMFPGSTG